MNCDEVRRSVQDYVMRELEPESRRLFDAHLVECAECQRELALMTAVVSTLDHQPVAEPSAAFTEKVLAALPRQRAFVPSPWLALALAPVLGVVAWSARAPVTSELSKLLARLNVSTITVPAVTTQQVWIAAAAVVGFGLLVAAGGAVFCWETYLRD